MYGAERAFDEFVCPRHGGERFLTALAGSRALKAARGRTVPRNGRPSLLSLAHGRLCLSMRQSQRRAWKEMSRLQPFARDVVSDDIGEAAAMLANPGATAEQLGAVLLQAVAEQSEQQAAAIEALFNDPRVSRMTLQAIAFLAPSQATRRMASEAFARRSDPDRGARDKSRSPRARKSSPGRMYKTRKFLSEMSPPPLRAKDPLTRQDNFAP